MQRTCLYCTNKQCSDCICRGCNQTHCFATNPTTCAFASRKILKEEMHEEPIELVFDLTQVSLPITVDHGTSPDMHEGVTNNFVLQPINDSRGEY